MKRKHRRPTGRIASYPVRPRRATLVGWLLLAAWLATASVSGAAPLEIPAGGLKVELADRLSGESGQATLVVLTSPQGRDRENRTLLWIGGRQGGEATINSQRGIITARYVPAGGPAVRIVFRPGLLWEPGSRHTLQLGWLPHEGGVMATLRVDGHLAGAAQSPRSFEATGEARLGGRNGGVDWNGAILEADFAAATEYPAELLSGGRSLRVDVERVLGPSYPFWIVGNFPLIKNVATDLLDPAFYDRLAQRRPFVREINLVYLLGGRERGLHEWFQGVDDQGRVQADFTGMIALLQRIVEAGYTPRIVLDNAPYGMSDPATDNAYGNTAPPADEALWGRYVRLAVEAMIEAFGRERVASWTFRVGTEPDLSPYHWSGTQEDYLAHYDHTAAAMKDILPEAKLAPGNILNPAADQLGLDMGRQWGLEIIDHAATGRNAATGGTGAPMDWFSCSWYVRVGFSLSIFDDAMEEIFARLRRYPQFDDVPVTVGEFAVLGDEYGRRLWAGDITEWSASFYAALADRVYHYGVRQVYEWDHTTSGVYHPRAHVLSMLEHISGGQRVAVEPTRNSPDEKRSAARCGAIAVAKDGSIYVLAYNHRQWRWPQVAETLELVVSDPRMSASPDEPWLVNEWTVDAEHAAWARRYVADAAAAGLEHQQRAGLFEGSPTKLYGEQGAKFFWRNRETYARMAVLPQTRTAEPLSIRDGAATLTLEMPGHSVRLLELRPAALPPSEPLVSPKR